MGDDSDLIGLDEEMLAELAEDLGDDLAGFIQRFLESADEGLAAMGRALDEGDWDLLRERAHSIKGSAGYLGANGLVAALTAVEQHARGEDLEQLSGALKDTSTMLDSVRPRLVTIATRG